MEYISGRINIGEEEIRHRRLIQGWGGLVLAFATLVILYFFNFSLPVYILLFLPVYVSFSGFYQAHERFCIAFARNGVCNISGQPGETRDVIGRLNRNKDNTKANKMTAVSIVASALITLTAALFVTS
jgi:hypothetical protein